MSTTLTSTTTRDSLVKYDPPSVVKGKNTSLTKSSRLEATSAPSQDVLLNAIVPPKKYNMPDGSLWVQSISGAQATRSDVIKLQVRNNACTSSSNYYRMLIELILSTF